MYKLLRKIVMIAAVVATFTLGAWGTVHADTTDSTTYGSGGYGNCDYGQCTLTLSSGSTTSVNIIPSSSGKCTVASNTVSVLTDNTTGYNLTMTTSTTNNAMVGASGSLTASSGTAAAPTTLANNTWGWRIDSLSGFGAGPTSPVSSGSTPSVAFAGVPASNGTPAQLASTSSPANPAIDTTVWYGACANGSLPSGAYSTTVTYTAVTN